MKKHPTVFVFILSLLLAVSSSAKIGREYQMQLGNPSTSQADPNNHDNYLIQRDQYAMDYSDRKGEPNWVSWDLTAEDIGSSGRSDFIVDTTLPSGFYQVLTTDYSGSGYDRGHMCPSADRTVTVADNQVLFYMSNMIPQAPDNNQGVWANFETYCRSLTSDGSELLIVAGPSHFGGSRLPSDAAAIPGYVWKIVVVVPPGSGMAVDRVTSSSRVIAISIPNIAGVRSDPWQNYVTSTAQIEADTGYTFFNQLPASVASVLRYAVDGQSTVGLPVFTLHPVAQSAGVGGTASFTVAATGDGTISYQWFKDEELIPGATSPTLTLTNIQASDAGSYDCTATNAVGSAVSNAASLVVTGLPPTIVSDPRPLTASAGSSATLSVTVSGSPTLSYQWRKNGVAVAGATTSTLTFVNVQAADAGSYDVVVSNSVGSATSAAALLTVTDSAPSITTQPVSRSAAVGTTQVFAVSAQGSAPLAYAWYKDGSALSDGGSVSGSATAQLTLANVATDSAGAYTVVVSNALGSATSSPAVLSVAAASIYWDFATAAPSSGLPADLSGGTVVQGNNNGTTTLITSTSASGSYTGASGGNNAGAAARIGALNQASGGSAYFELTLTPASGKQVAASAISFGSRSTSTGPQAYAVYSSVDGYAAPVASGTFSNNSAWVLHSPTFASLKGAKDEPVTFRIYGFNGTGSPGTGTANWRIDDLKLSALAVSPDPETPVVLSTSPVAGSSGVSTATAISVTFNQPVNAGSGWFAINSAFEGTMAASVSGGPTTYTLTPPVWFLENDTVTVTLRAAQITDQASGTLHPASDYVFSFTTAAPVAPSITAQPQSKTVSEGGSASFGVSVSGSAPFEYQWRKDGVPIAGNVTAATATLLLSSVSFEDAGSYDCVVSNAAGSATSAAASLEVSAVAPSIVSQPVSQSADLGGSVSFSVAASGTAPLSYQWRKDGVALADGGGISGALTATLALSYLSTSSSGNYDVVVSNAAGTVTSAQATLGVRIPDLNTVLWTFATATPTSGLPSDVTGGTVIQGNNNGTTTMITTSSVSSGYANASGTYNAGAAARIGTLNQAANGSAYFEVTLTPSAGRQLVIGSLVFGSRSTSTGPQAYAIYSSLDGFGQALATGAMPNTSSWRLYEPTLPTLEGSMGASVTLRIYGYGGAGSPGTGTANWRIDDLQIGLKTTQAPAEAPSIVAGPSSLDLIVGENALLSVEAAGTAPLSYRWFKNGVALEGATDSTLLLQSVLVSDAGSYTVRASNAAGEVESAPAVLSVAKAQASVTLSNLNQVYDGQPKAVAVASAPASLRVTLTYDGETSAPTEAGTYAISASVDDENYQGTAFASLTIGKASASVALGGLARLYDGTPRPATATTVPEGLKVSLSYDGLADAPAMPGLYEVSATIDDPNYTGSASDTMQVTTNAVVRHAPTLNGEVDGSIQVLQAESLTLNGSASVSGDLLVPGTPNITLNGKPAFVGTKDGTGSESPNGYWVTLNGNAALRYLVRKVDALSIPTVSAPPSPEGTRSVSLNKSGDSLGDPATLRNLTLNGSGIDVSLPAGVYGSVTVNGNNVLTLGEESAEAPVEYKLQGLTLNGSSRLRVVGPVILTLASGVQLNSSAGSSEHPEWLLLRIASGGATLNGNVRLYGSVTAPNGTVTINGGAILAGLVIADRLTINGNGLLGGNE